MASVSVFTAASSVVFAVGRSSSNIPHVFVRSIISGTYVARVFKADAASPTSFSEQDSANNPTLAASSIGVWKAYIDEVNDLIHAIGIDLTNNSILYDVFDMATGAWSGATETVLSGLDPLSQNAFIIGDVNGAPHVVYGMDVRNMGTWYETAHYINKTGGSWSTPLEGRGEAEQIDAEIKGFCFNDLGRPAYVAYQGGTHYLTEGNALNATSFSDASIGTQTADGRGLGFDSAGNSALIYENRNSAAASTGVFFNATNYEKTAGTTPTGLNYTAAFGIFFDASDDIYIPYSAAGNLLVYDVLSSGAYAGYTTLETDLSGSATVRTALGAADFDIVYGTTTANNYAWTTLALGGGDALLADNVESASNVTAPAVGQVHAITADDIEAASDVTAPAVGQAHALTADDIETASNVTAPPLIEVTPLSSDDIEAVSNVTAPAVGQVHAITADDIEAASNVTAPAVGQAHALTADDIEAASNVTAPAVGQAHALTADDIEAASDVTAPSLIEVTPLTADDIEAASDVTAPAVGQVHAITADDIEAASNVTAPALAEAGGEDALTADDIEAASDVTAPAVGQAHALTADDIEAASDVTAPAVGQAHALTADDIEAASDVTAPAVGQAHALTADDIEAASDVTAPAVGQAHTLTADDIEAASDVTAPAAGQVHAITAADIEAASDVTAPAVGAGVVVSDAPLRLAIVGAPVSRVIVGAPVSKIIFGAPHSQIVRGRPN